MHIMDEHHRVCWQVLSNGDFRLDERSQYLANRFAFEDRLRPAEMKALESSFQ
jgi:hypothetical protein